MFNSPLSAAAAGNTGRTPRPARKLRLCMSISKSRGWPMLNGAFHTFFILLLVADSTCRSWDGCHADIDLSAPADRQKRHAQTSDPGKPYVPPLDDDCCRHASRQSSPQKCST